MILNTVSFIITLFHVFPREHGMKRSAEEKVKGVTMAL